MLNKSQSDFYNRVVDKESYADNGWDNIEKAEERYKTVSDMLQYYDITTVTDIGCGCGHLHKFLPPHITYLGVDAHEPFISKGLELYPNLNLIYEPDVSNSDLTFDNIVCLGTFTSIGDQTPEQYEQYTMKNLGILLQKTKGILILIGFRKANDYEDNHIFYTDINLLMQLADKEGYYLEIRNTLSYNFIAIFTK